jgi:hypothetical protein
VTLRRRMFCRRCLPQRLGRAFAAFRAGKFLLRDVPGNAFFAVFSQHPRRHSAEVGYCVDVGIIDAVEWLLRTTGIRTLASCQGEPGERPGSWLANICIAEESWSEMRSLLEGVGLTWQGQVYGADLRLEPPTFRDGRMVDYGVDVMVKFWPSQGRCREGADLGVQVAFRDVADVLVRWKSQTG